jgi:hypothetical protein
VPVQLDTEIMNEEAKLSDFKRQATKEALGIKFGALLELSEKATVRCARIRLPMSFLGSDNLLLSSFRSSVSSASCSSRRFHSRRLRRVTVAHLMMVRPAVCPTAHR